MMRSHILAAIAVTASLVAAPLGAQVPDFEPPSNRTSDELQVRHLRFLAATADPFTALAHGGNAPAVLMDSGDQRDLQIDLARHTAEFGLLNEATRRYRRYLQPAVDPKLRNQLWFELAQAWELRSNYPQAQAALDSIYGPVPVRYYGQRVPMEARLQMAQGRHAEAATKLRDWFSHSHRDPFARFNLGVALVRSGSLREGAGELDTVANMDASTEEEMALRDKANLVLGFGYLEIGQGATARALFQRVRLNGPYSDKALLGLGWAELAPDGTEQELTVTKEIHCREDAARLLPEGLPVLRRIPRKSCGPARRFRENDKFARKKGAETEIERYKRALIPWLELVNRDARSLAVQEGIAMVPYAYYKIGAPQSASRYYQHAVNKLEPQRQLVANSVNHLNTGESQQQVVLDANTPPAQAWLAGNPVLYSALGTPYYEDTLYDERFRAVARHLQDLLTLRAQVMENRQTVESLTAQLSNRLAGYAQSGYTAPAVLEQQSAVIQANRQRLDNILSRLEAVIANTSDYLQKRALLFAVDYQRHTNAYLSQVRLGMAQMADASGN